MTPSRVLAAIALVSALAVAEAHPDLYSSDWCTAEQHPTSRERGHGAPTLDASIGFTMAWAAPDGGVAAQWNEHDPNRAIPVGWEIATAEFKPGARHTLTVVNPDVGEMMVTCSHGSFVEFGKELNGDAGYRRTGVECAGKRYNTETFEKPNTRFVWNAPDASELGADTSVVFKVTTASGRHGAFRNNQATFAANASLPPPPPGASSATPPRGSRDETNAAHAPSGAETGVSSAVAAHGWFMTLAWGVLVPFGVWSARYGKAPPGGGDAGDADDDAAAWRRLRAWLRADGRWFKIHRACTFAGLALAFLGLLIMFSEVEKDGGGEHFGSAHSALGVATLVLGVAQPLNAYFRPDAPSAAAHAAGVGKSAARFVWEVAHRAFGALAFLFSIFAITSGTERAQVWGESPWRAKKAYDAYVGWLVIVFVFTAALELVRRRERGGSKRGPTHEEFKEVELADA